jgi:hypothetical protein
VAVDVSLLSAAAAHGCGAGTAALALLATNAAAAAWQSVHGPAAWAAAGLVAAASSRAVSVRATSVRAASVSAVSSRAVSVSAVVLAGGAIGWLLLLLPVALAIVLLKLCRDPASPGSCAW